MVGAVRTHKLEHISIRDTYILSDGLNFQVSPSGLEEDGRAGEVTFLSFSIHSVDGELTIMPLSLHSLHHPLKNSSLHVMLFTYSDLVS